LQNEKEITIYVVGSISSVIEQNTPNAYVLGPVDDLDDFYSRYDLYINPDILESGLKFKTLEALSYGRPVICTKAASTGIEVVKQYHQCASIREAAQLTKKCVKNPMLLGEMAEESKRVYDNFYATYPAYKIMEGIINSV
jgi:glycosyltransferase involved in cell wall biosynthesis